MKEKIEQWAADKGIDKPEGVTRQFLKLVEEFGESVAAIRDGDYARLRDAIGDIQVVAIIMALQLGENLTLNKGKPDGWTDITLGKIAEALAKDKPVFPHLQAFVQRIRYDALEWYGIDADECLEEVYEIISKRTGKTVNGVFIKEQTDA